MIGLTPNVFWALIPIEFAYICEGYNQKILDNRKDTWEQSRMLTYYIFSTIPSKSRTSYKKFCETHIPLPWDKEFKNVSESDYKPNFRKWEEKIKNINKK